MGVSEGFEVGLSLLGGRAGPGWAARAARSARLAHLVVGKPGEIPIVPPGGTMELLEPLPMPRRVPRRAAEGAAADLVDAFSLRRFDRVGALLSDEPWFLWGDGSLRRHPKSELIAFMEASAGRPCPAPTTRVKSYTYGELKGVLARGVPEAIDAVLGLSRHEVLVSLEMEPEKTPRGRVFCVFELDEEGQLVSKCLPLGSPDDAYVSCRRALLADEPAKWTAEQVVRRFLHGQASALAAERGLMSDPMFVRKDAMALDAVLTLVGQGPHRIKNCDVTLLGSRTEKARGLNTRFTPKVAKAIEDAVPDIFGRDLSSLDPELVIVDFGVYDPARRTSEKKGEAVCLMARPEDEVGRRRDVMVALTL